MTGNADYEAGARLMELLFGPPPPSPTLPEKFQGRFLVEHLYGRVWTRSSLPLRQRSLITVVALTALGCAEETEMHIKGALRQGVEQEEIEEIMLHLAQYCGWPRAVTGLKALAKAVGEGRAE